MERIPAQEARRSFSRLMGRVAFGNSVTVITKNGSDHVAVISMEEFRRYRELEDFVDNLLADKALEEEGAIPLEKIKAKYGL